ncbi:hypothetical protein HDV63DRAFT_13792 [Trichoderma sp. SZMC 28014]
MPMLLWDPPRAALDQVPFAALVIVSHFRAFFSSRSRDKSLILPFSLLPIHITSTTTTSVLACHRQRMEGLPSRGLYQLWTVSIHPSTPFFFHSFNIPQFSYQPLSLSSSTTYAAEVHPGRRSVFRLLSTTFYLTKPAYYLSPLSPYLFPLISPSPTLFVFTKIFILASGHTKMTIYIRWNRYKTRCGYLMDGVFCHLD